MWFLFDSHGYFEERADVPFFQGLVAVFMNGGITFLTTILTLMWISSSGGRGGVEQVLANIGLGMFVYSFFSSFLAWILISIVFYVFIMWDGVGRIEFFTVLNMTGLGFVPVFLASVIELVVTGYFVINTSASSITTTTHILIGGEFGLIPAIAMLLTHTVMLLWAAHVWIGGVHQLGGVSPTKSTTAALVMIALLWLELLSLALL